MERDTTIYEIKEQAFSKDQFINNAIRYDCDVCGCTHTSLEIFDDNDVILCPRCEFYASYENAEEKPEAPVWFSLNHYMNSLDQLR